MVNITENMNDKSTVYGPVKSWRLGQSLGIDLLFQSSICSFNCLYCQLGHIQNITLQRQVYVSTEKVIADYRKFLGSQTPHDVVTYSGNGEPTLASNLKRVSELIRSLSPGTKQVLLTNGTTLKYPEVREAMCELDHVIIKFDAGDEETFQKINRPAKGVSLKSIQEGTREFKKEYKGSLEFQIMAMPANIKKLHLLIDYIEEIQPDVVQINSPKRPYPLDWEVTNRGNHNGDYNVKTRNLSQISEEQAQNFENQVSYQYTGKIIRTKIA